MRSGLLRLALVLGGLAACGRQPGTATGSVEPGSLPGSLPASLADLVLVEDHPQIPPARFPHARHVNSATDPVACSTCHHELTDRPDAVPRACRDCHVFAYLLAPRAAPIDESAPHEHPPPDL